MLFETLRIILATLIGTTITDCHQLSNLLPMSECDTLSTLSGDIKTNKKSDVYPNSGTNKNGLKFSKSLRGLPMTACLKNGKEY